MSNQLTISVGQYSAKGRKETNQDFHGVYIPEEPLLHTKGIAIALADGISSSDVSQIASEAAVTGFLTDYFCTSEAWSVKKSVQRVLIATNSWLYAQTRQGLYPYEKDRGYVCTFSALVLKSTSAYLFHVGDARIYRLQGNSLEQLTDDHRLWVGQDKSYLSRALGIASHIEIDYQTLPLEKSDIFLLATDGVYEYVSSNFIITQLEEHRHDLDTCAKTIANEAYRLGSTDNLTIQLVRTEDLPAVDADESYRQLTGLPFPPILQARMEFDGYTIVREIHASSRSHVYLAVDNDTGIQVVIKAPSIDLRDDQAYLEGFLLEDWIAHRIDSPFVLKPCEQTRKHNFIYITTEYIEGRTLTQWMIDNPRPELETVRGIVEQIAKGLRAFHRLEMLHQDLRPDNILIDKTGTVKIIDFGSTRVAGLEEISTAIIRNPIPGTAQYTAPEYFLGASGTPCSDLFSLGVITYQILTAKLPYGVEVVKARSRAAQNKLRYRTIVGADSEIPAWIDDAISKAVHPNPYKRYQELSEFIHDLRRPNRVFLHKIRPPLMERNPVVFWQGVSLILTLILFSLLIKQE
ncbi:bifunctional protein-serine/threonine kinase/phosphatase [Methylomarinum sp. Ch1-1]|uniref:Bifunctional protein-serine/threonine kinase/phosphatase n=1 Tax=Methylomarinum roseum TaxID=3067653 RepID=A0AAU7NZ53_9GAMM|nr:bifunctional protein-serine/threonine kinase/phosphatase [Methylomarinum sp. Ch1-1]MDP4521609.1 bifunctional protein-serine/threonine kinase/phosphatase [Methylomarinum sp. Ch1-1]